MRHMIDMYVTSQWWSLTDCGKMDDIGRDLRRDKKCVIAISKSVKFM